ncbi:Sybindin-like family-domain-containing protein [Catenaria anguillulae PL171]|uniref:Trafficking protein particle complex subunit n=1 Tax=Catenaria anguillulae PL171 TaxID=765915 RepID=A0A1Y2HNR2_9FUNG|nr:Sybindin-like family-domain-containing protein [Catenaria anguillulae PL171]
MIYSFHIFDRHCDCIFHADYMPAGSSPSTLDPSEQNKLVYGVIYSARNLVTKLRRPADDSGSSPTSGGLLPSFADSPFHAYSTSNYKLHYYEAPTSLKLVLITAPTVDTRAVREVLKSIYADIYVEHVVKNPLAVMTPGPNLVKVKKRPPEPGTVPAAAITNEAFKSALDRLIRGLMQGGSGVE